MIVFTCTCGEILRVKDDLAGRRGRCAKCRAVVDIPQQSAVVAPIPPLMPASPDMPTVSVTSGPVASESFSYTRLQEQIEILRRIELSVVRIRQICNVFFYVLIVIPLIAIGVKLVLIFRLLG